MDIKAINTAIISGNWSDADLNSMGDAIKFARSRIVQKNIFTMRAGAQVQFTSNRNGMTYKGTVEKVGRKFITVRTPQGGWRVPANMLSPA
jgi:hypothetical protein